MKRPIILAGVLAIAIPLGGCPWVAETFGDKPSQETKTTILEVYTDACTGYTATAHLAAQAIAADLVTAAQVDTIERANNIAGPICTGPLPTNLASVVVQVLSATLDIATAINKK